MDICKKIKDNWFEEKWITLNILGEIWKHFTKIKICHSRRVFCLDIEEKINYKGYE